MLLTLLMLLISFVIGLLLTGVFTPDVIQEFGIHSFWFHVGIFTLIAFIIFLLIYEDGRRYLDK